MGVVDGLSKARTLAIEAASIVSGTISGGNLILTKHDGGTINAGSVIGPTGPVGVGPTGFIGEWPTATPPTGWLICDGSEQALATYPALGALLGTLYGALTNGAGGVGTTHFRLPNYKGRTAVGFDASQAEFNVLGETGGFKTHTLVAAEMPAHAHGGVSGAQSVSHVHPGDAHGHTTAATAVGGTSASHTHDLAHTHSSASAQTVIGSGTDVATAVASTTYSMDVASTSTNAVTVTINGSTNNHTHALGVGTQSGGQSGDHTHTLPATATATQTGTGNTGANDVGHTHSITSAGADGAHNNLQPYIAVNKIIKT